MMIFQRVSKEDLPKERIFWMTWSLFETYIFRRVSGKIKVLDYANSIDF
jgi:hypothetical protein